MNLIFGDFETYWSVTHSLSKMNPIEYVMHPETELQSLALAVNDGPVEVYFGEAHIRAALMLLDWQNSMFIAHNGSGFDHLILRWRLGIKPKAWGCTLAMARPFYSLTVGGSLKKVAEAMGLPIKKGSLDEVNTKGKKLSQFTPEEIEKMRIYNRDDTELCRMIFHGLIGKLGVKEMRLIDLTCQMTVEPELEADYDVLENALSMEQLRKQKALLDLASVIGITGTTIEDITAQVRALVMSQHQFAALLERLGCEVPMKESNTALDDEGNPKLIPALAKNDPGLEDLLEHDDYRVQVAAQTRLDTKSTQLETRLQTYLLVANNCNGRLPMPVNYCGAGITWRMSGGMKMNVQNMPRVDPKFPKPSDALRQSIVAPEGKIIVAVDSSNIELRVAHALAGQMDTVEKLRNKEDLYCWFAESIYDRTITKDDKMERYLGKQAMLQLQFNASWRSFQRTARVNSKGEVDLSDQDAKRIVAVWRERFPMIAGDKKRGIEGMWNRGERCIAAMHQGDVMGFDDIGLVHTSKDHLITPDGHWLMYPELRQNLNSSTKRYEWKYGEGRNNTNIFGGKLFANTVQHIARLIVMEQTLKLAAKYKVVLSCHDEAVMCVNEGMEEQCQAEALSIFATPPKWWPDLPLAADAGIGYSYADCK